MRRMEFVTVKSIPAMRRDIRVHRAQYRDVIRIVASVLMVIGRDDGGNFVSVGPEKN